MPTEPTTKRTVAFVDGQNLFHAAKEAFGYIYPNYDVLALATTLCKSKGWDSGAGAVLHGHPRLR